MTVSLLDRRVYGLSDIDRLSRFVDGSALGLGKLLASTWDDVVYAGCPDLPEIPFGTIDVGWMPIVVECSRMQLGRRERRIHTRPLEVRVFSEVGLRPEP